MDLLAGDEQRSDRVRAEHPGLRIEGWAASLLDVVTDCLRVAAAQGM
jgi:hypothetical protein